MLKLYSNIKRLREERGWSQTELAKRVGYSEKSSISRIEAGNLDITAPQILKFCEVFGVDLNTLWGDAVETVVIQATKHEEAVLNAYRAKSPQEQGIIDAALGVKKMQSSSASLNKKEA